MKADIKKMLYDTKEKRNLWDRLMYDKFWPVTQYFYKVIDFFHMIKERVKRSWAYAKFGWLNFDFDSGYMFDLMLFKLKRIQKCIIEDGHHVVEDDERKSLRVCIKLLERICRRDYGRTYTSIFSRPNVKTSEDEEKEREEFRAMMNMEDILREQDVKKFFAIYQKYYRLWWD